MVIPINLNVSDMKMSSNVLKCFSPCKSMKYIVIKRCWEILKATEGKKKKKVVFNGFSNSFTQKHCILKMTSYKSLQKFKISFIRTALFPSVMIGIPII